VSVENEADHATFWMPVGKLLGTGKATPVTKVFPVRLDLGTDVLHLLLSVLKLCTIPPVTCAPPLVVTPVIVVLLQFPVVIEATAADP
jgi:hypothetical protein